MPRSSRSSPFLVFFGNHTDDMATLEVHDSRGAVEYVSIRPEKPIVFGSDPKCDLILKGSVVLPFHGRISWKGDRYKVEAFPEAKSLDFNGKKVISASFRTGDEVRIGECVLFMASSDEPSRGSSGGGRAQAPRAERLSPAPKEPPRSRQAGEATLAEALREESAPSPLEEPEQGGLFRRFLPQAEAPGQERIWSSPLVLVLVLLLIVLSGAGIYLWKVIRRSAADKLYASAVESFNQGSYRNAMAQFDQFLRGHSDDVRANKARVLYAMADVRQFAGGATPSWTNVLNQTRKLLDNVGKLPEFEDEKIELAGIVLRAAEGLADKTRAEADAQVLKETEGAVRLLDRIAGKAADAMKEKARFPARFAAAQAAVTKAQERLKTLALMDKALQDRSAVGVYQARDDLLFRYNDLAEDPDLTTRLDKANELLRAATRFDATSRPGQDAPRPEPLGPPTSLVLRLDPDVGPTAGGAVVYALAGGFAYALDGATGAPLWHVPLGLTSPFTPQPVTGGIPSVLAFDARYNDLVRLDARTGALIWRQEIGEPIADPPVVLGNQVIVASPVGHLTQIDFETGEVRSALDLGRKLTRSPVADETGRYLYVMGDEANVFLVGLERNRMSCVGVEYIGHASGSIACPPARVGRYLVVIENQTMRDGRWTVFLLDEEGSKARRVQQIPVAGWTWATPTSAGKMIFSTGDRGGISAFAIGPYDKTEPFQLVARVVPDAERSGPAFARARSERELWRSSSLSARFDLDPDQGTLNMAWTLQEAGPALAPIQVADRLMVLTHQYAEGLGVALWGVNPADGKVAWRTVLGAPWVCEPTARPDGSGLATAAVDGRPLTIPLARLQTGGFVQQPLSRPGSPKFLGAGAVVLTLDNATLTFPTINSDHFLRTEGDGAPTRVNLPEPLVTTPLVWGGGLLVPASNGWVYLIDPRTGEAKVDPFMPVFDRTRPIRWRTPARIDEESVLLADEAGRVYRLVIRDEPRPRLISQPADAVELGSDLGANPLVLGTTVLLATADDRVRALSTRDLSAAGAWKLDGPRAAGPFRVGDLAVIAEESGRLLALGGEGQTLWTTEPGSAPPLAGPVVGDGWAWFVGRDGAFRQYSLQDGRIQTLQKAEFLPAGDLQQLGDEVAVPVASGTVRLLIPSAGQP
jgi:outer membrane protein assembly factor BamB